MVIVLGSRGMNGGRGVISTLLLLAAAEVGRINSAVERHVVVVVRLVFRGGRWLGCGGDNSGGVGRLGVRNGVAGSIVRAVVVQAVRGGEVRVGVGRRRRHRVDGKLEVVVKRCRRRRRLF